MIDILSPQGLSILQSFVTPQTLCAFDLDGTLAPIIADPDAVALPATVRQAMQQLCSLAPVAVITGRGCDDARQRLGFMPRYLVGNHGLEGLPDSSVNLAALRVLIDYWSSELYRLLPVSLVAELLFEPKAGSLSLHYRHAADPAAAHQALLEAIAQLQPQPRYVGGKYVENLVPHGVPHKGDALLRLMEHSGAATALFVGDDETDEDVFRLVDPQILSVCVGTGRSTAARYFLQDQTRMVDLLAQLLLRSAAVMPGGKHG